MPLFSNSINGYAVRSHWRNITCRRLRARVLLLWSETVVSHSRHSNSIFNSTHITLRTHLYTPTYHTSPSNPSPIAIMDPEVIPNFLADQRDNASADSQHYFITFEDYWERKLWHELTNTLVEFFNQPGSASQRLPIYNTFIKTFAEKINQLKLVELGLRAATQCQSEHESLFTRSQH